MTWPAEHVPDQAIFAPHHLYVGLLVVTFAAALSWNDRGGREPALAFAATITCWFAFEYVWPNYHAAGAALTLLAATTLLAAVLRARFWTAYPWRGLRGLALTGVLIALDDLTSHAFGVWTPLDALWHAAILPLIT